MRKLIALASVLCLVACVGARPAAAQAPDRLVVDSGAVVRIRLTAGDTIVGRLLAPFTPASRELVVCDGAQPDPCTTAGAPSVRHLGAAELGAVAVRGKQGGNVMLLGLYAGAVAGGLAYRDASGGSFAAGGVLGAALGHLIGSRVTGWVPLFPCGAHGQCLWRGAWPAADGSRP